MQQLNLNTEMKFIQCGTCAVWHAIPELMYTKMYNEGGYWFCPNGHERGWREGANKTEIAKEKKRREWAENHVVELSKQIEELNKKIKKQQREESRLKKRASAGVCPCCNRTFQQLARHMSNKHPEYGSQL